MEFLVSWSGSGIFFYRGRIFFQMDPEGKFTGFTFLTLCNIIARKIHCMHLYDRVPDQFVHEVLPARAHVRVVGQVQHPGHLRHGVRDFCWQNHRNDLLHILLFSSKSYHVVWYVEIRDDDPDPVGSVNFRPAGSITFFIGSGSITFFHWIRSGSCL